MFTSTPRFAKLIVTVPSAHAHDMRTALAQAGAGEVGNYSQCSFSTEGTGRFFPNEHANPTIGESGQLESVNEERIEVMCSIDRMESIVRTMLATHPYEEPMYEMYPIWLLEDFTPSSSD